MGDDLAVGGEFFGGDVWATITPAVRECRQRRRVAVAYLGASAASQLPLRRADLLIVGATTANARAGAINPESLQEYMDAGVHVLAHQHLHAKVMRLGDVTVVGSANASPTSQSLEEAVIISRSIEMAKSVDRFIDRLKTESIPVGDVLLGSLRLAWERRVRGGALGVAGTTNTSLWPSPGSRVFLDDSTDVTYSDAAEVIDRSQRASWRRKAGAAWRVETYQHTRKHLARFRTGDLLILRHWSSDDSATVYPPAEVLGEAVPVPRSRNALLPLRYPTWIEAMDVTEFDELLRSRVGQALGYPRQIQSPKVISAVLDLFELPKRPG